MTSDHKLKRDRTRSENLCRKAHLMTELTKALDLQDISISLMDDIIALIYPDKEKDGTRTRIKYTAAELLEVWL